MWSRSHLALFLDPESWGSVGFRSVHSHHRYQVLDFKSLPNSEENPALCRKKWGKLKMIWRLKRKRWRLWMPPSKVRTGYQQIVNILVNFDEPMELSRKSWIFTSNTIHIEYQVHMDTSGLQSELDSAGDAGDAILHQCRPQCSVSQVLWRMSWRRCATPRKLLIRSTRRLDQLWAGDLLDDLVMILISVLLWDHRWYFEVLNYWYHQSQQTCLFTVVCNHGHKTIWQWAYCWCCWWRPNLFQIWRILWIHTHIYMYMFNGFMLVIIKIISSSLALFCIVGYRYISDCIRWFPIWSPLLNCNT